MLRFEWDPEKNQENIRKHGISFENAIRIFQDPLMYELYDELHSGYNKYGVWEDRYIALGLVDEVLYVVYAVRDRNSEEVVRMISARAAERVEAEQYRKWSGSR